MQNQRQKQRGISKPRTGRRQRRDRFLRFKARGGSTEKRYQVKINFPSYFKLWYSTLYDKEVSPELEEWVRSAWRRHLSNKLDESLVHKMNDDKGINSLTEAIVQDLAFDAAEAGVAVEREAMWFMAREVADGLVEAAKLDME